jgi:hypothetical protein
MSIRIFTSASIILLVLFLFMDPYTILAQKKVSKYPNGVEMKKGVWFSSLTFSAGNKIAENDNQLLFVAIDQKKSNLQLRLDPGYVIRQNLAVGMGILYGFNKETSTRQSSDGIITDYKSYQREYAFRPFVKNFIPLGKSHKFYVVIPTELQFGYGSRITEATTNQLLDRTYTNTYYYGLEMRPGLLAFIVENFGFEINVGAFGLSSSIEKTTRTNFPDGEVKNNDLSLKINLLQLSFGFAAYF